jgi:cell division protein FtsB
VIEEAVQPIKDLLARYDEVNAQFGDPDADFDALADKQAKLQDEIDRLDAGTWTAI